MKRTAGATVLGGLTPAPLGGLAVLVLVLAAGLLLREVADVAVPLLCGAFLAVLARPMHAALERTGMSSSIALALTTLVALGVAIAGFAIIAMSIAELAAMIPRYGGRLEAILESLGAWIAQLGIATDREGLIGAIAPEQLADRIEGIASSVSGAGGAAVIIGLTMVFALSGASRLGSRMDELGRDDPVVAAVTRFATETRRYLLVRAQLGLFAAVLSFALLVVLGIPLAGLWACLAFAGSFIPNIGALMALIPPALLALMDLGVGGAAAVVVGYGVINFVQDNVLQPVALGAELNLTPIVGFVGFVAWAWVFGAAGAILAVPLTIALVEVLGAFPATQGLAALAQNEPKITASSRDRPGAAPANA